MATYAIGDVHGCYDQLQALLVKINFQIGVDTLWFTGDLINGGPKPVETLRFIKSLGKHALMVLGNHDLVLLGIAAGKLHDPKDREIGFEQVLAAPDCAELLTWLRMQPLVHYDAGFNALIVHAGILPQWDLDTTLALAAEVETILRSDTADSLYTHIYGDKPDLWDENLTGWERIRFILNCFTRIRFCDQDGRLDFVNKSEPKSAPPSFTPWFKVANRKMANIHIIFGHWAALMSDVGGENVSAIDTGCAWGRTLTALRLDDRQLFSVPGYGEWQPPL